MPAQDDDLLARLNALKPSSVSLSAGSPSIDVEVSEPQSIEDKLADRLKRLRDHSSPSLSVGMSSSQGSVRDAVTAQPSVKGTRSKDAIRDWQQESNNEQSLDDLIAELGESEPDWKLHSDERDQVEALLKEANAALPTDVESTPKVTIDSGETARHDSAASQTTGKSKAESELDEEEADEYVKRLLAEIEVEDQYDEQPGPESKPTKGTDFALNLPSTPSDLRQPADPSDPPSYEDSELESRFAKLGLDLPSTPTNKPSSSKPKVQASLKPPSNLPAYTDEDINSWCCICNEDGELKCIDCDNDIYCHNCWNDGHGSRPGQERGHRALSYTRPSS